MVDSTLHLHSSTSAVFGSVRQHWRTFETEFGLRLDSQNYRAFGVRSQLTPRLNIRYDPATNWHVYASWGEFSQAQRIDEFREEQNQSNPDAASRASHSVVGIAHEPLNSTRWRMELYRNHWSSVSPYEINALGLMTLLPELQPDRVRVAPLSSESDGIELSARRSLGTHFTLWSTYTLSRTTDRLPGATVARSWDQRQAANLGLAWSSPKFAVSALLGWHSGWPRTAISAITGSPNGAPYLLLGAPNAERWGNYLSADVHLSRSLFTRRGEVSLWVDVTNATNRDNDCCTELAPIVPPATHATWSTDAWPGRSVNVGLSWHLRKDH
jgi:outer membrane receptor protein involved in Fe transport